MKHHMRFGFKSIAKVVVAGLIATTIAAAPLSPGDRAANQEVAFLDAFCPSAEDCYFDPPSDCLTPNGHWYGCILMPQQEPSR